MDWTTHDVKDWAHFTKLVDNIVSPVGNERHHFLFRGQVDAEWTLQPSLLRSMASPDLVSAKRALKIEHDAGQEFRRHAHLHLRPSVGELSGDNRLDLWALMQHHRAPTRLLDWTSSPYVAAYFAVEATLSEPGAVWVVDKLAVLDRMGEEYGDQTRVSFDEFVQPNAEPKMLFLSPARPSERMVVQQGSFSVSTQLFADHATIIGSALRHHQNRGWHGWNHKIMIPGPLKPEFLLRLRMMNISANSLFPGIDGLGQSVKEYVNLAAIEGSVADATGIAPWYIPAH